MSLTAISFKNDLSYDVIVYDSQNPDNPTDSENNYLGQLTQLAQVPANSSKEVMPLQAGSAFVIESASAYKPVKRCTLAPLSKTTLFSIAQADEDAMTETLQFLDFTLHNQDDALTKEFKAVLQQNPQNLLPAVNAFFQKHADYYKLCTFQTYMMGAVYVAQHPESIAKPPTEATYSLSKLVECLGGTWPDGMPDVTLSHFTCSTKDDVLDIKATIDLSELPFETDLIKANVKSLLVNTTVKAEFTFNLSFSPGIFGTRLALDFANFTIPAGSAKINVTQPTITIDINPLFKFVVLTIRGILPFTVFNKAFNADLSMTIDNVEAHVGLVVEGDKTSFPAPPGLKGLHFDEFGLGMGLIFTPPGFALGIQGKFHVGEPTGSNVIALNDDTFALVCAIEEGVPVPLYAAFYVPQLNINQVLEIFTDASPNIDLPVEFSDLSFKWAADPMEPVVLPDGSLSEMAFGYTAAVSIYSFGFYGDVSIDLNNGLTADVEASPMSWHNIFKLAGDGKGVTIKVDQNGKPIRNNEIRDNKVLQDALKTATDRQIVSPGGPVLNINTLKMPILHLNAKASLFDLLDYSITADINQNGIKFVLDYGAVLMEQVTCTLSDFHNLAASFKFNLNRSITLPTVGAVHFGWFPIAASVETYFYFNTTSSDIAFNVGGWFDFEGLTRNFSNFRASINITKITDLLKAIGDYIEQEAKQLFGEFVNDAEKWAEKAKAGFISTETAVATVLKDGFNKSAAEAASIMKTVGYSAGEVAEGIKDAWNYGVNDVTAVMRTVGYTAAEAVGSIQAVFNAGANDAATALKYAGYATTEVASTIQTAYNLSASAVSDALKYAGYAADEVKNAFDALGGDLKDYATKVWDTINPSNWF